MNKCKCTPEKECIKCYKAKWDQDNREHNAAFKADYRRKKRAEKLREELGL